MRVRINIDGGSRGNPGPAGAGVIIRAADDGTIIHNTGVYIGEATNNVAEYSGLIEGLKRAAALGAAELEVFSDSELLVKQLSGEYRVKNEKLIPLFEQALELSGGFEKFTISHVPRDQNREADALASRAMNLKRDVEDCFPA